jgi:GNAT superfamily N-acetyltransferase
MSELHSSPEPLTKRWVSSACRLSTQAGWNQTEEDWSRLSRLAGASVKVFVSDGEVRASYSVVGYESRIGWIGMVLVDEAYRGKGLGKTVFTNALREATGFGAVGLDATDLGEPIYLRHGFEAVHPIVRWLGNSHGGHRSGIRTGLHEGILTLDAEVTGIDRKNLLCDFSMSGADFFSLVESGSTLAYGVLRAGRTACHLGPVVARSAEGFQRILDCASGKNLDTPILCDVLNANAESILAAQGWRSMRALKRMIKPPLAACLCADEIWCAAGFELG